MNVPPPPPRHGRFFTWIMALATAIPLGLLTGIGITSTLAAVARTAVRRPV